MDDATRLTLAMIQFVSRFIPVKRQSRFLSGRISRPSQQSVGASPFSTFPATSLAKPRAQQRDVPQNPTIDEAVAVCSKGRLPPWRSRHTGVSGPPLNPEGASEMCYSIELGPHPEWRQLTEIEYGYAQVAGSRSAPIGTPPRPIFTVKNQYASPNSVGVLFRC